MFPAFGRKPVKLCLAMVLAQPPIGGEQAAVFKTMEGGIQRALLDFERIFRGVLDHLRYGVAVCSAHKQGAKDEHIERSLKNLARRSHWFMRHRCRSLECLGEPLYSTRMSMERSYFPPDSSDRGTGAVRESPPGRGSHLGPLSAGARAETAMPPRGENRKQFSGLGARHTR